MLYMHSFHPTMACAITQRYAFNDHNLVSLQQFFGENADHIVARRSRDDGVYALYWTGNSQPLIGYYVVKAIETGKVYYE